MKSYTPNRTETFKVCKICGNPKPIEQFIQITTNFKKDLRGNIISGYVYRDSRCDECRRAYGRAHYKKKMRMKRKIQKFTDELTTQRGLPPADCSFWFTPDLNRWH